MTEQELSFMQDLQVLLKKHSVSIMPHMVTSLKHDRLSINIFDNRDSTIDINLYGILSAEDVEDLIERNKNNIKMKTLDEKAAEYAAGVVSCNPEVKPYEGLIQTAYILGSTDVEKTTFEESVEPLIKYLAENHHPHTMAVVESNRAQIWEGVKVVENYKYVVD